MQSEPINHLLIQILENLKRQEKILHELKLDSVGLHDAMEAGPAGEKFWNARGQKALLAGLETDNHIRLLDEAIQLLQRS